MNEILNKYNNIELHETIHEGKLSHYWYGGIVASIKVSDSIEYELCANGDVYAELYTTEDNVEVFVKDKRNNGTFYHEMEGYIKDDNQLIEYIRNADNDIFPCVKIINNNWWELFVYQDGEEKDAIVLEADSVAEAIEECMLYAKDLVNQ